MIMRFILLLLLAWASIEVNAHQMSTAYFTAETNRAGLLDGQLQVRLYDLELALGVDNGDGQLLWQEVLDRQEAITHYLTVNLFFVRGEQNCSMVLPQPWQLDTHFNEPYLVLPVRAQCPLAGEWVINYHAFFNEDSQHKLLLTSLVETDTTSHGSSRVMTANQRSLTLNSQEGDRWVTVQEFIQQGVIHIWIGIDHILFLCCLLLTCVVRRQAGRWVADSNLAGIVRRTIWIVTAFTLAHSVTLSATALGWIALPSRWVEVGIAATVIVVALNNVFPLVQRLSVLTFGFGLLHGMGFAGVLNELGLPGDQKLLTVLAFNVGVELGQLAIVLLALPLLVWARHYRWYRQYALAGGSLLIAAIAVKWLFERL